MHNVLPLLVVVPLAAAFLIPLLSLVTARRNWPSSEIVALLAVAILVVLSFLTFGGQDVMTVWIGGYRGQPELLGIRGVRATSQGADGGILIDEVIAGSRADDAGLKAGDVVLGLRRHEGDKLKRVTSINHLRRENAALPPGTRFILCVDRQGETLEKAVSGGKGVTGIAMVCDGLTRLMLVVISIVSLAAILFSLSYMRDYTKLHLYYSPIMLMIAGMIGIVVSGDLFNIYVFLEVAAVASYALVGFGVESEELEASFKYLVLSAVASAFILLGVAILYGLQGTLNLAQIADILETAGPNNAMWLGLGFFVAGFGLKAAMVPFHAWLPDAHPSAPAPISAMLSGLLIKASGVYVIARLVFNVLGGGVPVAYVMMTLGAASMLVGSLLMWGQWDIKRLLAYSSISHMGVIMLALGVGAEALARGESGSAIAGLAVFAAVFHLLNHAAFKSLLFLCSGSVVRSTGTRDIREAAGIGRVLPCTGFLTRIGALSISGVPPFNGFFSKLLVVIAIVWAGHWFLGLVMVTTSLITLLAFIKVQRYLLDTEPSESTAQREESPLPMLAAMTILAILCVGLGLFLPLYGKVLLAPAASTLTGGLTGYATSVFGG